eukprot:1105273-Amphidinium_carterae.1
MVKSLRVVGCIHCKNPRNFAASPEDSRLVVLLNGRSTLVLPKQPAFSSLEKLFRTALVSLDAVRLVGMDRYSDRVLSIAVFLEGSCGEG